MTKIPELALAVRQPWAWAIIHGGKDIENRTPHAVALGGMRKTRIAIHASRGLGRGEYESASQFMAGIGVICPPAIDLQRGGLIGCVDVIDIVREHASPWWFGPVGLVLANPQPCLFTPALGELGFYRWQPANPPNLPEPAKWMLPKAQPELTLATDDQGALL